MDTLPQNPESDISQFAAWVGIDWGDQQHAIALTQSGSTRIEHSSLTHKPDELDLWATALHKRFAGRPIAVCVEQTKGALIFSLMKYEHLVLYPINPNQLAAYRASLKTSGAKDDPDDAELALEFLRKHPDRVRAWKPDDPLTRLITQLTEDRRETVDFRTKLTNSLKSRLKQYFPQALEILSDDLATKLACEFLLKWSTLEDLQRTKPSTIRQFYVRHHCHSSDLIERRMAAIKNAKPLTTDNAIIEASARQVRMLAQQVLALIEPITEYDRRIAELMKQHPDAAIFQSFPGAGEALAPRLLAAFGTDRTRFDSARDVQDLSGIAPVTIRSGRSKFVRRRYACPKFMRQTFHEFADHSRARCEWAQAYYEIQREGGLQHHSAVRALAFKWIRILYRCWKNRTVYQDAEYLSSLRRRRSHVADRLAA